mmetsp:Transcript_15202/g.53389  ORF Transcript_15202/g.53389 Transcript_15202/m.53389 type:complete len:790 (+) Transcript_15202:87-2456(+)
MAEAAERSPPAVGGAERDMDSDATSSSAGSSQMGGAPSTARRAEEAGIINTFNHHESIYSFMVLYPELYRLKYGSYWNFKVFLAFALFALSLGMQVALTNITGSSILNDNLEYRSSLINTDYVAATVKDISGSEAAGLEARWEELSESVEESIVGKTELEERPLCCRGPACAGGLTCCGRRTYATTPTAVTAHAAHRSSFVARSREVKRRLASKAGMAHASSRALAPDQASGRVSFLARPGGSRATAAHHDEHSGETGESTMRTSVCFLSGNSLDCSQPTFAFVHRWQDLDFDGDGVWTHEEAEADDSNLGCRMAESGLDPEAVFRSLCRGIIKFHEGNYMKMLTNTKSVREASDPDPEDDGELDGGNASGNKTWNLKVPKEIQEVKAVPLQWFHFWEGLVVLCAATDLNRCGQLIHDGVFDGALIGANGRNSGLQHLNAALDFCQQILRPSGFCDQSLPVTFVMYRKQEEEKCGSPHFAAGSDYVNPYDDHDSLQTVEVSYEKLGTFEMASTYRFRLFLLLILVIWWINLIGELVSIINLVDFCLNVNVDDGDPFHTLDVLQRMKKRTSGVFQKVTKRMSSVLTGDGQALPSPRGVEDVTSVLPENLMPTPRDAEGSIVIASIARPQLVTCWIMVVVRVVLLVYMAGVGSVFIVTTYSFPDLLMNAVALAFVFELPVFLFALLVDKHDKELMESMAPIVFQSSLPLCGRFFQTITSTYFIGLVLFPLVCIGLVQWDLHVNILPTTEALECLCFQRGPRCVTNTYFQRSWWDEHWENVSWVFDGNATRS